MTAKLPRLRRRWIALAVIPVLVVVAVRLLDSASWIYYYRIVNDQTLVVGTVEGPGAWTRVTSIDETPSTITVTVSSLLVRLGAGTSVGIPVESVAKLHDPLRDRTVVDGNSGLPVMEQATAVCKAAGVATGWGTQGALVAAMTVTASDVTTWAVRVGRDDAGAWQQRPPSESATLCYFDGQFSGFPVPPGAPDTFDRVLILVPAEGDPSLVAAGRKSTLPLVTLDALP
jgi:hypothetical protein